MKLCVHTSSGVVKNMERNQAVLCSGDSTNANSSAKSCRSLASRLDDRQIADVTCPAKSVIDVISA